MTWAVYANEVSLASLGVYVQRLEQYTAAPAREYATVAIPGRQGVVFAGDPVTAARTLTITASVATSANTVAARATAEDALKAALYRALIKVVVDDDVNAPRQIDGVCTSVAITTRAHPVSAVVSDVTATVLCPDPTWADVTGQIIAFGTTASAIPLGTAPSGGIVRITPFGTTNVVDPTLSYLNAAGVTIAALAFTGTLTAGTEYLEIDLDRATVVEVSSGTSSNAISWLTSGDFFGLDPMDGDPLNGSYPQLKVTATSGTPTATITYTKRWL